jgi:hypothetical protein
MTGIGTFDRGKLLLELNTLQQRRASIPGM